MFVYDDAQRQWWLEIDGHGADEEQTVEYFLVGLVIGLAIHNGVILNLVFPHLIWKKLLGHKVGLEDLKDAFPETGDGLQRLLDWDAERDGGAVADVFGLDFTATAQSFGENTVVELQPGGADMEVTEVNRQDYVRAFTEWRLI